MIIKNQVWHCQKCHMTKPKGPNDMITHLLEGGIKCPDCGIKMEVKDGSTVPMEPSYDQTGIK